MTLRGCVHGRRDAGAHLPGKVTLYTAVQLHCTQSIVLCASPVSVSSCADFTACTRDRTSQTVHTERHAPCELTRAKRPHTMPHMLAPTRHTSHMGRGAGGPRWGVHDTRTHLADARGWPPREDSTLNPLAPSQPCFLSSTQSSHGARDLRAPRHVCADRKTWACVRASCGLLLARSLRPMRRRSQPSRTATR